MRQAKAVVVVNGHRRAFFGKSPKRALSAAMEFFRRAPIWGATTCGVSLLVDGNHRWGIACPGVGIHTRGDVPQWLDDEFRRVSDYLRIAPEMEFDSVAFNSIFE